MTAMTVPIRNIWLLQLYASALYRFSGAGLSSAEENPEDLPELVARILTDEVIRRLHTGLTVGFTSTSRPVTRVRGRINLLTTERHQLLRRGLIDCTFDEIVTDTPVNRLVRTALERAAVLVPQDERHRSLALRLETAGVRGPCPPLSEVPELRRQRLHARDHLMIAAAELLLTLSIPDTASGGHMLPLPSFDLVYLRRLFEHAAFGLYRHHLAPRGWVVMHGRHLKWPVTHASPGAPAILPGMKTDVTLEAPPAEGSRRIVIDTKFNSVTTEGQFGQETLRSGYVYQIYAYVMSQDELEKDGKTEGLLLHPSFEYRVDEEVVIQGHRIRFATVDLANSAHNMTQSFLAATSRGDTSLSTG